MEIIAPSAVTSNRVITLPDATTTMLGTDTTATVTNKTIDGDNNTLSNLDIGNEVDWAAAGDVSDASAFESGDKMLIFEAGVGLRKIDYDDLPSGSGDVTGPASSTDNAVARFDSTTGKIIQNSVVTIGDTGDINSEGQLTIGTSTQGSQIATFLDADVAPSSLAVGTDGKAVSVQGDGAAYFHGKDYTNSIEFLRIVTGKPV